MKTKKLLMVLFLLAAVCFFAGTINHIFNTKEGWISSLLLGCGSLCISLSLYKNK